MRACCGNRQCRLRKQARLRHARRRKGTVSCIAYTMRLVVFEWDENNLRKLRAHRITANEVEQALARDPILVYEQDAGGESRHVYYGETHRSRLLAIVITESKDLIRVITAYDLDAGQKRDYLTRALRERDL